MRKTIAVIFMVLVFSSPVFSYSTIRNAQNLYPPFDDALGKGEFVGEVYRLHSKRASFTRRSSLPQEAQNATTWNVEAEILAMEGAGGGLFLLYSRKHGLGAEIAQDGTLSLLYMEFERDRGTRTWQMAETRLSEVKLPIRLGITFDQYSREYSVMVNGARFLSGNANAASYVPLIPAFDTLAIKTSNTVLNQQGYCDFGEIAITAK